MEPPPPSAAAAAKVSRATIEKAVDALLKWKNSKSKIQKPQLLPQDDFIYLNLTLKKIPSKPRTNPFKIPFPHPLHDPFSSELCLIIDDRPNSNLTSDDAKKIIKSQNIPITKVIKISKLKSNYKPFEAKRKLCDSYDLFLVDRRVVHLLPKLLGKQFFKKKKLPLPLDLTHKNWKEQVERACGSGLFYLKTGTCCVMKVGKVSMESELIVENVVEAIKGVVEVVPKKWGGVRSLHLRLCDSLALPLYQALPDIKLKIQGFKEKEVAEERGEEVSSGGLVEVKETSSRNVEGSDKKKGKTKGRIHEVRYMDFDTGVVDELGSDDDVAGSNAEEESSDEDIEESEDYGVKKVKKGKAEKGSIFFSELNGEKAAKKLREAEQQKKNKLSLQDGKRNKSTKLGKKLKDGSLKEKSKRSKIRA